MPQRLQQVNGDTVLEITDGNTVMRRLSKNTLLRDLAYFQDRAAKYPDTPKFQDGINNTNADLQLIYEAEAQS